VCLRLSAGREKEFFSKLSVNSVAEKVSLMQDVYYRLSKDQFKIMKRGKQQQ